MATDIDDNLWEQLKNAERQNDTKRKKEILQLIEKGKEGKNDNMRNFLNPVKKCESLANSTNTTSYDNILSSINVRINITYKDGATIFLRLNLASTTSVLDLKLIIFRKYKIEEQYQRWIFGDSCPADNETLWDHDIKDNYDIYMFANTVESYSEDSFESGYFSLEGSKPCNEKLNNLSQFWKCNLCASNNDRTAAICKCCGTYQNNINNKVDENVTECQNPWACKACTLINDSHSTKCQECGTSKQGAVTEAVTESGWECEHCTFLNKMEHRFCEMCSKENKKIPSVDLEGAASIQVDSLSEWSCKSCTFLNSSSSKDCAVCGQSKRPGLSRQQRGANMQLSPGNYNGTQVDLLLNEDQHQCSCCCERIGILEGVVLRECLHFYCRECLKKYLSTCSGDVVICPYNDEYACNAQLLEREVKALKENTFFCQTNDCTGFSSITDANQFFCYSCSKLNCVTCRVIHDPMSCKEYQDDLCARAKNDPSYLEIVNKLNLLIDEGEAMRCPECSIIIQKKDGCDWIQCSMCNLEICWLTKGPRWGFQGVGDTSAGCGCKANGGQKCHPDCKDCH